MRGRSRFGAVRTEVCGHSIPVHPIPRNCYGLERAGRVKDGAAAERSEGILDAREHSNMIIARGMGRSIF